MAKIKLCIQNGHRNTTNGQTGTSGIYNGQRINEVKRIPWNKGLIGVQKGFWLGKKRPDISKRMIEWHKGYKPSEETKKKIGLARKGKKTGPFSKEHIVKLIKSHLGKKQSIETRIKRSLSLRGSKSHFWNGGLTEQNYLIRHSLKYKLWRKSIFERDNYICILCGVKNGNGKTVILQADHIKPFSLFPELRFSTNNGRTLCRDCHKKTDTYGYLTINKYNQFKYE